MNTAPRASIVAIAPSPEPALDYSVVAPLYNEAGNVDLLLTELREALSNVAGSYEVVLVDDGSRDETGASVLMTGHDDRLLARLASMERPEGEASEHRDVEILQSLPGVGRIVAATMLTDATGPLADRDYATLRAHAGAAPVTKRSGKRAVVHMRYACKGALRQALYHWARTSIQLDAAARAYYKALRARGHRHGRALRSVGDRWLRILIAMLKTRTLYDATRFAQAEALPA